MQSIIVKDSFYNSSIVQGLRMLYTKDFRFTRSSDISPDLVFPFCSNLSFAILYYDHLDQDGITRIQTISQSYSNFITIICISPKESTLYERFICKVPFDITAVICFPIENFQKSASSFIYNTVSDFKQNTRGLEKVLETKRKNDIDPDTQANSIFSSLIKPTDIKNRIMSLMIENTGTIRNTMIEGLPELFKYDFYMESDDCSE